MGVYERVPDSEEEGQVKRVQIAFLAKVQANIELRFEEAALLYVACLA